LSRGLRTLSCSFLVLFAALTTAVADAPKGERVFTAGHSFHWMIPKPLEEIAKSAKIEGHESLGTQAIGGSATLQHWNLPDEKNKAKQAIQTGKVDVLTLSPIFLPDAGIDNFVKLALEKNTNARILVQGSWMPFDDYFNRTKTFSNDDRNKAKIADLRAASLTFDNQLNEQVAAINARYAAMQKRGGVRRARGPCRGEPARKGPRRQSPRHRETIRPLHRPDRPPESRRGRAQRVLPLRRHLQAKPRRPARPRVDEEFTFGNRT